MKTKLEHRSSLELTADDLRGVGAIITDPPYGIALSSHCGRGVKDRKASYGILGDESQDAGLHIMKIAKDANIPVVAFFSSPYKPWPGTWRNLIVWDKGGGTGFGGDTKTCLRRTWEMIQVQNSTPINEGRPEAVWRCTFSNQIFKMHNCAKPVPLMERLISTFVPPRALILDPFMGSGSTGVAAKNLGYDFWGIELDEAHYKTADERIKNTQPTLL